MRIFWIFCALALVSLCPKPLLASGDDPFNAGRTTKNAKNNNNTSPFNQGRANNFNDYREKLNAEYVKLTREQWRDFSPQKEINDPDKNVKPVAPVVMPDDDANKGRIDNQVPIQGTVTPVINKQNPPTPIAPIQESPDVTGSWAFTYLGTDFSVRKPTKMPMLRGVDENSVADAWAQLCTGEYNNLIIDCLGIRKSNSLCDWAYLMMLKTMAEKMCGTGSNEAVLLMAFVYSQSGYKIRLGRCGNRLEMLYSSQHIIYDRTYYQMDGVYFYPMTPTTAGLQINAAHYPKESSLSLWVPDVPDVKHSASNGRLLQAKRYPDMAVKVSVNKNLIDFYNSYPTSEVGGNFMTRWAMYANASLSPTVKNELYPQLRGLISGLSQQDAANKLINWVQTAFVYEYDDKVWGGDRAFFAEETLYYPYCDCEDRSILFTRLMRDLLGLKCVLIYYPGHLASAVNFTENVAGDYIMISGQKFVICDPTYIGAPIGATMPNMDNSSAKAIILQ